MNVRIFPYQFSDDFTERDRIIHTLIEDSITKKKDIQYVISMLDCLKDYRKINGDDCVIDMFFMKYLKKCENQIFNKLNDQITSQYHIAYACYSRNTQIIDKILSQWHNFILGNKIIVLQIEISHCIYFNILRFLSNSVNKDYLICNFPNEITRISLKNDINIKRAFDYFPIKKNVLYSFYECFQTNYSPEYSIVSKQHNYNEIKESINNHSKIHFYSFKSYVSSQNYLKGVYDQFKIDMYQYLSVDFWSLVAENEFITDYTINVSDNPYLLNAAACLSYVCRRIKVIFDIRQIRLPDKVTEKVNRLIRYELGLRHLLEYPTDSNEVKNLCSLVYLFYLSDKSIESLLEYMPLMNPESFIILVLVYSNYRNESISDSVIKSISGLLDSNKINDFLIIKFYFSIIKSRKHLYPYIPQRLLYAAPKTIYTNGIFYQLEYNIPLYGLNKRSIVKGNIAFSKNFENNKDFQRFLENAINFVDKKTKKILFAHYKNDFSNESNSLAILLSFIDDNDYNYAYQFLSQIPPTKKFLELIQNSSAKNKLKILLRNINAANCSFETLEKFNLQALLNINEKYNIFFSSSLKEYYLEVSRNNIINDSIRYFNKNNMENKQIKIRYDSEEGQDAGGLARDWFTAISEAITKSGTFMPVPNGDTLIFNKTSQNDHILYFTGQLIGLALTNQQNINIKLTSLIWKQILNHQITIEDMKDYDIDIYQSLKWILENDVSGGFLTFVNSNDEELIKDGRNIEVDNENKEKYIKLIIEDKLIKPFKEEIELISSGFNNIIRNKNVSLLYTSEEIKKVVIGKEVIDIEDWKSNTKYLTEYKVYANMFFDVISKWPFEKQQKLLKFVTGSSQVPINGFQDYSNRGGLFKLHFIDQIKRLPSSHTCTNHLDIPCYKSKEDLENALTLAIECTDFGFI